MSVQLTASDKQVAFPESQWNRLQDVMEAEGIAGVRRCIEEAGSRAGDLYSFAQQAFFLRPWAGKSMELCAEVGRAGVAWHLHHGQLEGAFAMNLRLAFDLAEWWSADGMPRERGHARLGCAAAHDCLRWALHRDASPQTREKCLWILGIHQLALRRWEEAEESFLAARDLAQLTAGPSPIGRPWWPLLHEAFATLATVRAGNGAATAQLAELVRLAERGEHGTGQWESAEAGQAFEALLRALVGAR